MGKEQVEAQVKEEDEVENTRVFVRRYKDNGDKGIDDLEVKSMLALLLYYNPMDSYINRVPG